MPYITQQLIDATRAVVHDNTPRPNNWHDGLIGDIRQRCREVFSTFERGYLSGTINRAQQEFMVMIVQRMAGVYPMLPSYLPFIDAWEDAFKRDDSGNLPTPKTYAILVTFSKDDADDVEHVYGPFKDGQAASDYGFKRFENTVRWCWYEMTEPKDD